LIAAIGWRGRRRLAVGWAALVLLGGIGLYVFKLNPSFWTWNGDRHLRADRLVPAERAYQRALDIDVDHARALYGLGWAYLRAGLIEPSRDSFQRAVDVAPGYFGGYRGLAAIDVADGEVLAAEANLRRAYELAPGEPAVLADLAGLYVDREHPEEGLDLFRRAIELAPERAEYRLGMAEACLTVGRVDEARSLVEEARGLTLRNLRFAGAADELMLRVELVGVEQSLATALLDGEGCDLAEQSLQRAQQHLDVALEQGLEGDVARADRRRLETVRESIERDCSRVARGGAPGS
jgi:tetratricopeptide (TPR) repeat protein